MWPLLIDMTREECKRVLRRLELEAYSSVISVFRAQGSLTKDRKKQLQDLQATLSISTERHRAEVRRAVNDEKLNTIADNTVGPDTNSDWLIEGRRLVPLMPRLVPQTAFTLTANQAANFQAEKNAALPSPSLTGSKEINSPTSLTPTSLTTTTVAKVPRSGSPTPSVVVVSSGINIKDEVDENQSKKRKRSHSSESVAMGTSSLHHPRVSYSTQTSRSPSPMKITISKSPQTKTQSSLTTTTPQKVILLSSSGQSTSANILQKSMSVPVIRGSSSSTTHSSPIPKSSIIYPGSSTSSPASNGNLGNIVTVATTSALQNVSTSMGSSPGTVYQPGFTTPTGIITKPRPKTITRQRLTPTSGLTASPQRPGLVVPMGSTSVHTVSNPGHIKSIAGKPTIQIKQEGGMKIITQTLSSSKLLPKPSSLSGSGSPIVVVSSGSQTSSSSNLTVVSRPSSSASGALGSKILNITTQGGKVIATTNKNPNVVTVNPKTLHLTAVKTAAGVSGAKPNVIVVQKSHSKKSTGQGTTMLTTKSRTALPLDKDIMSFIQKHDAQKFLTAKTLENRVILTTSGHDLTSLKQKSRSDGEDKRSLLAELIHAANQEGSSESTLPEPHVVIGEGQLGETTADTLSQPIGKAVTPSLPSNEWFEYDVTDDVQTVSRPPKSTQSSSQCVLETPDPSVQITTDQLYSIEQAIGMVNPGSKLPTSQTVPSVKTTHQTSKQTISGEKVPKLSSEVTALTSDLLPGDLDPQTGIFHSSSPVVVENLASQSMDLLSTSLAEAQIDLHPYQFMEDDLVNLTPLSGEEDQKQKEPLISILTGNVVQPSTPASDDSSSRLSMTSSDTPSGASSFIPIQEFTGKNSATTINVTTKAPSSEQGVTVAMIPKGVDAGALTLDQLTSQRLEGTQDVLVTPTPTIDLTETSLGLQNPSRLTDPQPTSEVLSSQLSSEVLSSQLSTEVLSSQLSSEVLSSKLSSEVLSSQPSSEVLSSQPSSEFSSSQTFYTGDGESCNVSESGNLSEQGNISDGGQSSDSSQARASKRRRKPPSAFEESPTSSGSWLRAALGLLNKVCKVRGSNREFDASSWFLYPVDPEDAPDYFNIIKRPMDFSTIKKKLEYNKASIAMAKIIVEEYKLLQSKLARPLTQRPVIAYKKNKSLKDILTCQYSEFEDFNNDMLLVRDNCNIYNPPGHQARTDCQEVFNVYHQEYAKLVEKWQKSHISSPVSKKLKLEKSPGKS